MNKLFITLFIFSLAAVGKAQTTKVRKCNKDTTVQYIYDYSKPMLRQEGTKRVVYYPAKIQVMKGKIKIDDAFDGVYSPEPCRKDSTHLWVRKAVINKVNKAKKS